MAVGVCQACRVHLPHTWNGFIQSTPAVIGTFREAWKVNYPNDKNYANSSMSPSFCLFSPFFLSFRLICFCAILHLKLQKRLAGVRMRAYLGLLSHCEWSDKLFSIHPRWKMLPPVKEQSGLPEWLSPGEMSGFISLTRCSSMSVCVSKVTHIASVFAATWM